MHFLNFIPCKLFTEHLVSNDCWYVNKTLHPGTDDVLLPWQSPVLGMKAFSPLHRKLKWRDNWVKQILFIEKHCFGTEKPFAFQCGKQPTGHLYIRPYEGKSFKRQLVLHSIICHRNFNMSKGMKWNLHMAFTFTRAPVWADGCSIFLGPLSGTLANISLAAKKGDVC